jgi:hypothetical protein
MKSSESMWKLARWAKNRGEAAPTTPIILKDPTTNIEHAEAQDKARVLKATFFPTPPEPDLQDIWGAEYQDQIPFPDITEKEVLQVPQCSQERQNNRRISDAEGTRVLLAYQYGTRQDLLARITAVRKSWSYRQE